MWTNALVWAVVAVLVLESFQLAAVTVLAYRSRRHALDPLGLYARVDRVEQRVGVVERLQAEATRLAADTERRLFDRLESIADQHAKMLGHVTAVERIVESEVKRSIETHSRMDQIQSAVANVARRFGALEDGIKLALDARKRAMTELEAGEEGSR